MNSDLNFILTMLCYCGIFFIMFHAKRQAKKKHLTLIEVRRNGEPIYWEIRGRNKEKHKWVKLHKSADYEFIKSTYVSLTTEGGIKEEEVIAEWIKQPKLKE